MNINFSPVDKQFIENIVEDGYYSNVTEAVRDAVRRMREAFNNKHARLVAALEAGDKDIREGRTVRYTPEFLDDCEKRARENVANGIKPNPDVCP
jgi:antitoxin ParD1/3/4